MDGAERPVRFLDPTTDNVTTPGEQLFRWLNPQPGDPVPPALDCRTCRGHCVIAVDIRVDGELLHNIVIAYNIAEGWADVYRDRLRLNAVQQSLLGDDGDNPVIIDRLYGTVEVTWKK
jgi:hypothetical protein